MCNLHSTLKKLCTIAVFCALVAAALYSLFRVAQWAFFESHSLYTADSGLYFAVGRGILNGLTPYIDIYESKPPGIFLISALSLWLTNDIIVGSALQAAVIIGFPIVMGLGVLSLMRREHRYRQGMLFLMALSFGSVLGLYAGWRSGSFQVESFGALFACLYIMTIAGNAQRMTAKRTVLASLWMFLSIGLKEPFLLSILAGALILTPRLRSLRYTFFTPLLITIVVGIAIMTLLGYLSAYITIHLDEVFGKLINGVGRSSFPPLWKRGFEMWNLFDDTAQYSTIFAWTIITLLGTYILSQWHDHQKRLSTFWSIAFLACALYLTTLSVGMGGPWWNHHYILALPCYAALFLSFVHAARIHWSKISLQCALLALIVCIASVPYSLSIETNMREIIANAEEKTTAMKQIATQVDGILSACQHDRYLFLGHNGLQVFMFTHHSPFGPVFQQNNHWISESRPFFRQRFIESMDTAQLIVMDNGQKYLDDMKEKVDQYIKNNFTEDPWPCARPYHPPHRWYTYYYRKNINTDVLQTNP